MPYLVVVCGLPGVGKSTTAEVIADRLDAELSRTDAVRKEIRAEPRYDREESRRVYGTLFDRARDHLADGRDVVLDGTFSSEYQREWARDLAGAVDCGFEVVKVICDEAVAVDRIAERDRDSELSDASLGTYYEIMKAFEPLSIPHVRIDNSGSPAATERQVEEWCAQVLSR